jgi:tRNA A-37 threonylcarbamoyl transferase component Bud32
VSGTLAEIEGKYEILERLQVGGMGAIYKVRHRLLGDERVVKVMRPQLMHDPELRQRFHREARAATRLIHPNIARLYDFAADDVGNAYIVMEYIPGWTLDDLIARGELPPLGLTLEIADQGLRALGHLHAQGVIHRDISPDNLMLTRDVDGRAAVKLIDLGLIKSIATSGNLTAAGVFVGKFRYASPEQFGRGAAPGPTSDLYSFGLVLYELLTGRYPILGKSASSLIAGHLFRAPLDFGATDLAGRVPEDLRRVVMRALAKEPADRHASAAAFAAALAPLRRRFDPDDDAARRLLELIGEPCGRVRRIEALIAANDFAAAREELRQAVAAEGETPELWELGERIAVIEEITAPSTPPARQVEAELAQVEALRAAGRLEEALDKARALRERAPRHKLIRQVVVELEKDDEAARAPTTLLEIPEDDVGRAPTELLPQVRRTAEPPPALATRPLATVPPPPAPPAHSAPTAVLRRSVDEISLLIPRQPRTSAAAGFDAGDLPLGPAATAEDAAVPPPRPRSGRRAVASAALIVAASLALGLALSGVLSGPRTERESVGADAVELSVSGLLRGLDAAPSERLRAAAEAFLAGDFDAALAATAAGGMSGPHEEAWAHLLRAAACHALYVRGGEEDPALRERSLEEIRAGRAADDAVVPGDGFSPSFVDLVASTR